MAKNLPKRKPVRGWINCKSCGNKFYNPKADNKCYCSNTCKKKATGGRAKNKYTPRTERIKKIKQNLGKINCLNCKKEFIKTQSNQKYCSKKCCESYWQGQRNKILAGDKVENLNGELGRLKLRFEIFKRDSFTCTYCGRNVKEDKIKLHLDHIKPKSKGGKDSVNNYTTSCEECNLGKRDTELKRVISNV